MGTFLIIITYHYPSFIFIFLVFFLLFLLYLIIIILHLHLLGIFSTILIIYYHSYYHGSFIDDFCMEKRPWQFPSGQDDTFAIHEPPQRNLGNLAQGEGRSDQKLGVITSRNQRLQWKIN